MEQGAVPNVSQSARVRQWVTFRLSSVAPDLEHLIVAMPDAMRAVNINAFGRIMKQRSGVGAMCCWLNSWTFGWGCQKSLGGEEGCGRQESGGNRSDGFTRLPHR
jgi:hypothetical protein